MKWVLAWAVRAAAQQVDVEDAGYVAAAVAPGENAGGTRPLPEPTVRALDEQELVDVLTFERSCDTREAGRVAHEQQRSFAPQFRQLLAECGKVRDDDRCVDSCDALLQRAGFALLMVEQADREDARDQTGSDQRDPDAAQDDSAPRGSAGNGVYCDEREGDQGGGGG